MKSEAGEEMIIKGVIMHSFFSRFKSKKELGKKGGDIITLPREQWNKKKNSLQRECFFIKVTFFLIEFKFFIGFYLFFYLNITCTSQRS